MSHPWKAQPYYLAHVPRTSGSVPAPLGGYSAGSFTPKSPWATPKYVAQMQTGVNGFGAFGQADNCTPFESIQGWIKVKADALVKGLPATGVSLFDNGKTMLTGPVATLLTKLIREAASKGQNIENYVKAGLRAALKGAVCSIPGVCGISGVGGINIDGVLDIVVPYIQEQLFDIPNVCPPATAPTKSAGPSSHEQMLAKCGNNEACHIVYQRFLDGQITEAAMWKQLELLSALAQGRVVDTSFVNLALPKLHVLPGVALTQPPAAVAPSSPQPPAAASAGLSPVVIGAAALAALMFLK